MKILLTLWQWLSLGNWRKARYAAKRRERYEFLKARISERHFAGFAGLIVDFKGRKFDKTDLACFKSPMYYMAKNQDMKWCIFWDKARMAREIGAGAPLREGECLIPDTVGRTKPQGTIETIEEKSPLIQTVMEPALEAGKV